MRSIVLPVVLPVVLSACVDTALPKGAGHDDIYRPPADSGVQTGQDSGSVPPDEDSGRAAVPPGDPDRFLGAGGVALPGPCGTEAPQMNAAALDWELTETGGGTDEHGMPQIVIRMLALRVAIDAADADGALHEAIVRIRAEPGTDGFVSSPRFVLEERVERVHGRCAQLHRTVAVERVGIEGTSTLLFGFGESWDLELTLVDADGHASAPITHTTVTPR